jgi:hypothetical protein
LVRGEQPLSTQFARKISRRTLFPSPATGTKGAKFQVVARIVGNFQIVHPQIFKHFSKKLPIFAEGLYLFNTWALSKASATRKAALHRHL